MRDIERHWEHNICKHKTRRPLLWSGDTRRSHWLGVQSTLYQCYAVLFGISIGSDRMHCILAKAQARQGTGRDRDRDRERQVCTGRQRHRAAQTRRDSVSDSDAHKPVLERRRECIGEAMLTPLGSTWERGRAQVLKPNAQAWRQRSPKRERTGSDCQSLTTFHFWMRRSEDWALTKCSVSGERIASQNKPTD